MIRPNATLTIDGSPLIDEALDEQGRLTAVERFSKAHDAGGAPAQERYYRDLLPGSPPGPGQQYAFEVDMDACSGCKACVTACHNLNGLDETETWRDVGLLVGGPADAPVHQHVTSACHHCVEPACMDGCPVNAYEKDDVTGIVRHLDDQCIGCQYCVLKCPYDVPKYNKSKGIVRKCDMCSQRLEVGEAPACVQACPNEAIKIRVIDKQDVIESSEYANLVPGAADPDYTLPTTTYKTERVLPRNLLPANYYAVKPEHAHFPLVIMLVLTQMSVGALVIEHVLRLIVGGALLDAIRPIHSASALVLGLIALAASTMHLGRPMYAFRAIIGLRTSWLSREIVAFGAFAKLAAAYALVSWFLPGWGGVAASLGIAAVVAGIGGVFCSAMIYHDTRRVFWNISATGVKFFGTALLVGIPAACATSLLAALGSDELTVRHIMETWGYGLCGALVIVSTLKLLFEATVFVNLKDRRHTPMKRTAMLMSDALIAVTLRRFAFGVLGGIAVPGVLLVERFANPDSSFSPAFIAASVCFMLVLTVLGELHERYQFFTAVVSPKMPGGVM